MSRARSLPPQERDFLSALIVKDEIYARVQQLHEVGWSLAEIACAWDPPKQRSTVHSWLSRPSTHTHTFPVPSPPSSSSSSSSSSIPAAEKSDLAPALAPAYSAAQIRRRRVFDPSAPVLSPAQKTKISRLAPLARRYRARTPYGGTYATANRELTHLCRDLYLRGASVRELSLAAGVTYRAMARRLGR